jgi:hypothetical protein
MLPLSSAALGVAGCEDLGFFGIAAALANDCMMPPEPPRFSPGVDFFVTAEDAAEDAADAAASLSGGVGAASSFTLGSSLILAVAAG